MKHVIGIDAGGTKTVGLLADQRGHVLAEARAGGANLQTHGELEVEKVLHDVISQLAALQPVDALCLGVAGVDRPQDEAVIRGVLRRLGRTTARIVNDATIALLAGAPERFGIVILAGTGSIVFGLDRKGRSGRAGGLGYLLADEGSGYWLGHQALRAAVRGADGRGPQTALIDLIFEHLGIASVSELVPLVYERGMPKDQIARMARLVERARADGDVVSAGLLEEAARELALAARSVARQLGLGTETFPLVLAGGAFKACPTLAALVEERFQVPRARVRRLEAEPATGAVVIALDLLSERQPAGSPARGSGG